MAARRHPAKAWPRRQARGKRMPARDNNSQNKYAMPTTKILPAARNRIWRASIRANMGTFSSAPSHDTFSYCNKGGIMSAKARCRPRFLFVTLKIQTVTANNVTPRHVAHATSTK
jgi:hypothetical protein